MFKFIIIFLISLNLFALDWTLLDIKKNYSKLTYDKIKTNLNSQESYYFYMPKNRTLKISNIKDIKNLKFSYSIDGELFSEIDLNEFQNSYYFESFLYNSIVKVQNLSDKDIELSLNISRYIEPIVSYESIELNATKCEIKREKDNYSKEFYLLDRELNLKFDKDEIIKIEHRILFEDNNTLEKDYFLLNEFHSSPIDKFNKISINDKIAFLGEERESFLNVKKDEALTLKSSHPLYMRVLKKSEYLLNINDKIKSNSLNKPNYIEKARDNDIKESALKAFWSLESEYKSYPFDEVISKMKQILGRFSFHKDLLPSKVEVKEIEELEFSPKFISYNKEEIFLNSELLKNYTLPKAIFFKPNLIYTLPKREDDSFLRVIVKYSELKGELNLKLNDREFKLNLEDNNSSKEFINSSIEEFSKNFASIKLFLPKEIEKIELKGDKHLRVALQYVVNKDFRFLNYDELKSYINEREKENHFKPLNEYLKRKYEEFFKEELIEKFNYKNIDKSYHYFMKKAKYYEDRNSFLALEFYTKASKYRDENFLADFKRFEILRELKEFFLAKKILKRILFNSNSSVVLAKAINWYLESFENEIELFSALSYKKRDNFYLQALKSYFYKNGYKNLYELTAEFLNDEIKEIKENENLTIFRNFDGFVTLYSKDSDKYSTYIKAKELKLKVPKDSNLKIEVRLLQNIEELESSINIKSGSENFTYPISSKISENLKLINEKSFVGTKNEIEFLAKSEEIEISSKYDFIVKVRVEEKREVKENKLIELLNNFEKKRDKKIALELIYLYLTSNEEFKYISRINQEWKNFENIESSSGIEYKLIDSWNPISPSLQVRKALMSERVKNILYSDRKLNFIIEHLKDEIVEFRVKKLRVDLVEDSNLTYCYEVENRVNCNLLKDIDNLKVKLSKGENLVKFWIDNPQSNQFISIDLKRDYFTKESKLPFYVATKSEPIKFYSNGVNLFRIYKEESEKVEIDYILTKDGVNEVVVKPKSKKALVKISKLSIEDIENKALITLLKSEDLTLSSYPKIYKSFRESNFKNHRSDTLTIRASFIKESDEEEDSLIDSDYYELSLFHRLYSEEIDSYFKSEIFYRDNEVFGVKEKFLHRISNYPLTFTVDLWLLAQKLNSKIESISTLKTSLTHFKKLNEKVTNSFTGSIFGRYLSQKYFIEEIDSDIFSEYKLNHQYGLSLSDTIKYRPYLDTLLFTRAKLSSNENFSLDNYSLKFGVKQLIDKFELHLDYTYLEYLKDRDRSTDISREYLKFAILFDWWSEYLNRFNLRFDFKQELSSGEFFGGFFIEYNFSEGRGFRDFIGYEREFVGFE